MIAIILQCYQHTEGGFVTYSEFFRTVKQASEVKFYTPPQ